MIDPGIVRGRFRLEVADLEPAIAMHPGLHKLVAGWRAVGVLAAAHAVTAARAVCLGHVTPLLLGLAVVPTLWVASFLWWRRRRPTWVEKLPEARRELALEVHRDGLRIVDASGETRERHWSGAQQLVLTPTHACVVFSKAVEALPRRAFASDDFERAVELISKRVHRAAAPPRPSNRPLAIALALALILVLLEGRRVLWGTA